MKLKKQQALEILMVFSALESWSFSTGKNLPDYLHERLAELIDDLSAIVVADASTKKDDLPTPWKFPINTMQVCSVCGNKRCPKANNQELACTGSNDLGQDDGA